MTRRPISTVRNLIRNFSASSNEAPSAFRASAKTSLIMPHRSSAILISRAVRRVSNLFFRPPLGPLLLLVCFVVFATSFGVCVGHLSIASPCSVHSYYFETHFSDAEPLDQCGSARGNRTFFGRNRRGIPILCILPPVMGQ